MKGIKQLEPVNLEQRLLLAKFRSREVGVRLLPDNAEIRTWPFVVSRPHPKAAFGTVVGFTGNGRHEWWADPDDCADVIDEVMGEAQQGVYHGYLDKTQRLFYIGRPVQQPGRPADAVRQEDG